MSILRRLYPRTQHLGHAPCLRDATAGLVRLTRIEDLTDGAEAVVSEMNGKYFEKFSCALFVVRMNFQPGIDKRADEPGPNRALMISTVARAQVAGVNRFVFRIVRRKGTEP